MRVSSSVARAALALAAVALAACAPAVALAADYAGPLIDAHSHLPNATAIDAYAAAARRHGVTRVVLLGVGGLQKDALVWIEAAARKYPALVVVAVPVPEPTSDTAAKRLDADLTKTGAHVAGEVHVRQVGRTIKIDRNAADPAFVAVLAAAAKHGAPVVIHDELDERAVGGLEKALEAEPKVTIVLAHAGSATPAVLDSLLVRHANLRVDLSGMHFQRTPALATEKGPLDPTWKGLIAKHPDRFLMGIDVWAPRLFEPAMLDRLMTWTRRVLGELPADVAERVAWKNAAVLYRIPIP